MRRKLDTVMRVTKAAGKESGNEYIEFTGCSLEFFEVYR